MTAKLKRSLKTWMVIYVAFAAVAVSTSASGVQASTEMLHVPAIETTGTALEQRFFESRSVLSPRIDF